MVDRFVEAALHDLPCPCPKIERGGIFPGQSEMSPVERGFCGLCSERLEDCQCDEEGLD